MILWFLLIFISKITPFSVISWKLEQPIVYCKTFISLFHFIRILCNLYMTFSVMRNRYLNCFYFWSHADFQGRIDYIIDLFYFKGELQAIPINIRILYLWKLLILVIYIYIYIISWRSIVIKKITWIHFKTWNHYFCK